MAGQGTGALIDNLSYTHKAMVDLVLERPAISQGEIARHFGYTEGWVSQVIRSDSFLAGLAERKGELLDPILKAKLDERLEALAHRSLDVIMEKLDATQNAELAMKALELTTRAKGYGAGAGGFSLTQNFVVAMPQKSASSDEWAAEHKPQLALGRGEIPHRVGAFLPVITVDTPLPDLAPL